MNTLVLVHGYFGGSPQWTHQVTTFSEKYHVVTPDLPGFGLNNDAISPESIGGYADFVLSELTKQGVDQFHLLGHSMGGMIVQEMVQRAPHRIDHLILYGTGPVGQLPGRFETLEASRRRVRADGAEVTGRRISATWFLQYEQANRYPGCADIAALATEQAALAGLTAMETWSGEEALAEIQSPTLVLWGDKDRAYEWSQPYKLWTKIEHAQLAVVPNCSHAVHLEKPDLFNQIVMDFLLEAD